MVKNRVGGEQKTLLRAQQWPLEEGSLPEEKKKKIPGRKMTVDDSSFIY